MRTIKFRAWDKEKKLFIYSEEFEFISMFWMSAELVGACFDFIQQFTGLKDKNGVEIFEGDIVSIPYVDPMGELHIDTENARSEVKFKNGQFVIHKMEYQGLIKWCKQEKGEYVSNYGNKTIIKDETVLEVIGNIYQNPELL